MRYSEELQRVICWMLTLDQRRRATIDDLINLPLVSMRLREKRFEEKQQFHFQLLKKKEMEIAKREEKLAKRERVLVDKEASLQRRELEVAQREKRSQMQQPKLPLHKVSESMGDMHQLLTSVNSHALQDSHFTQDHMRSQPLQFQHQEERKAP